MKRQSSYLLCAALMALIVPPAVVYGQTSAAAAHPTTCATGSAPSEGDEALASGKYDQAVKLYTEGIKAGGAAGERQHDGQIQTLLRQDKLADARKDAEAWLAADPISIWSHLAMAEVLWREGRVLDSLMAFQDAQKIDPCNAQFHADYSRVLDLQGYYGRAYSQIGIAHKLDPQNPVITRQWMRTQPRAVRAAAIEAQLASDKTLTDEQRKSLEARAKSLSSPPTPNRCHLVNALTSTTIPYRGMRDGPEAPLFFGLEVSFNGKQRRLEIDTGATGLAITKSAANALHLTPEVKFKVGGIGDEGAADAFAAKVDSIKIGGLEFANCYVQVFDDSKSKMVSDGLIGGDVFSSFLVTLDFPGRTLKLDPLPPLPGAGADVSSVSLQTEDEDTDETPRDRYVPPTMTDWTKIYRSGHDIIVPTRLNDGPIRLFIIDTGAQLNLISPAAAREVAKVFNESEFDSISGISGKTKKVSTTAPLTLTFANLQQRTNGMTAIDTSKFGNGAGVEISGFIGAPTLHQLTMQIDYRDNLMKLTFDPKRIRHCVANIQVDDCY